jgi:hypothetical protein
MDKEEEQEGLFFLEAFVTLGVTKIFLKVDGCDALSIHRCSSRRSRDYDEMVCRIIQ